MHVGTLNFLVRRLPGDKRPLAELYRDAIDLIVRTEKLDFDFIFVDGEHGPFGLDQLEDLCRTAERYNVTPIARVPAAIVVAPL